MSVLGGGRERGKNHHRFIKNDIKICCIINNKLKRLSEVL